MKTIYFVVAFEYMGHSEFHHSTYRNKISEEKIANNLYNLLETFVSYLSPSSSINYLMVSDDAIDRFEINNDPDGLVRNIMDMNHVDYILRGSLDIFHVQDDNNEPPWEEQFSETEEQYHYSERKRRLQTDLVNINPSGITLTIWKEHNITCTTSDGRLSKNILLLAKDQTGDVWEVGYRCPKRSFKIQDNVFFIHKYLVDQSSQEHRLHAASVKIIDPENRLIFKNKREFDETPTFKGWSNWRKVRVESGDFYREKFFRFPKYSNRSACYKRFHDIVYTWAANQLEDKDPISAKVFTYIKTIPYSDRKSELKNSLGKYSPLRLGEFAPRDKKELPRSSANPDHKDWKNSWYYGEEERELRYVKSNDLLYEGTFNNH